MECKKVIEILEKQSPKSYACDWDNVGLLAGRSTKEVKKILLSLDATDEVVRMAAEGGYDMLITHHPMLFSAIKRVTDQDMNGRRLLELIRNDISYYAMHTNYDTRGMADLAARLMGLTECAVLEEVKDGEGIGRVGKLPHPMTLRECGEQVKVAYGIPNVRLFGDSDTQVSLVGICPGAGKSTMPLALGFGCDVYITGDMDHHTGIDAVDQGMCIIDAGHYGTEYIFMDYMEKELQALGGELEIKKMQVVHPFKVL